MNEGHQWEELRRAAAGHLPGDFGARLLARAAVARRRRRELVSVVSTLLLCISGTGAVAGWHAYRQHEANLAQWRELSVVTLAMERTL